jgi:hypothetical protein
MQEQSAIDLFLEVLCTSSEPVAVTSVGSSRIIACALNRDAALCRRKISAVYAVAGCAHYFDTGAGLDYNVKIDPYAYVRLFASGVPIRWYPCCAAKPYTEDKTEHYRKHSSRWEYPQRALSKGIDRRLHAWMVSNLAGNLRGDIIRALDEHWYGGTWWACIKQGVRWFWSTAAIVHAAGAELSETEAGWRFVPAETAGDLPREKLDLIPVSVNVSPEGYTEWQPAERGHIQLYERDPGPRHNARMGVALNALLRNLVPGGVSFHDPSPTIS